MTCGHIFRLHNGECGPGDEDGCLLAYGHLSPHMFRDENGAVWRWEYDKDCTCEDCRTDSFEDACRIYWKEGQRKKPLAKRV